MRKLKILILVLFILLIPRNIKAGQNDSFIDWTLDTTVFLHKYQNGKESIENLALITANGKTAYCIEPGVMADKGSYYNSTLNISDTPLNGRDIRMISLIGYYGYGYNNHNTKEYYMAAQELIWRYMGVSEVIWSDSKYNGNIINIQSYKDEIMNLVNRYEVAPNFNFKKDYIIKDELILDDINGVLGEYEVESGNALIDGNNIKLSVEQENNTFKLRRKKNGKSPIFYYKSGYQTIGTFEYAYHYEKEYNYKGVLGKINLEKYDYDTKSKKSKVEGLSLSDAVYGLYDDENNLIEEKTTDEFGNLIFINLLKGKYVVKEIKPSIGYTLDKNDYEIIINSDNKEILVKSYEKIIENEIIITKVLDDEENGLMKPEENIEFGIYNEKKELYGTYKTNKDGIIKLILPYGKYILKQLSSPPGITMVEDILIEVNKDNDIKRLTLVNRKIKQESVLPKTGKTFNFIPFIIVQIILIIVGRYEKKNL